jgi:isoleucyl-tRNA synthetase
LSNFEAGENYKLVTDPAVVVSFPLVEDPTVSLLAWTTTPWTLPSNLALCVNPELDYIKVLDAKTGDKYILGEARLTQLYKKKKKKSKAPAAYTILEKFKGAALKGKKYVPLFEYFRAEEKAHPNQWTVLTDGYVF